MLSRQLSRQAGFGLVELMIGLVISMIILAAASEVLLSSLTSNRDSIRMARLDQELRQVMTMISRDLRRATAWDPAVEVARLSISAPLTLSADTGTVTVSSSGDLSLIADKAEGGTLIFVHENVLYKADITAGTGYDSSTKTYSATITGSDWPTTDIPEGAWSIVGPAVTINTDAVAGTPGSCILFAYDANLDGTYGANEYFGYKLTDSGGIGIIRTRTSASALGTCPSNGDTWQNLSDELSVDITAFTITENSPAAVTTSGVNVGVREFTISITGTLQADPDVTRNLRETIRVRNEQLS